MTTAPRALRFWLYLTCLLLLANMVIGAFPFSPVEGDEQGVINGICEMINPHAGDLTVRYEYPLQPGAFWLTIGIRTCTGLSPASCYFALSAFCAMGFALLIALIVSSESGLGLLESLTVTLLFQEVSRAAFYGNSSTIGGFLVLLGLWVALNLRASPPWAGVIAAGCLFGMGGWCRMDSLVLTPCLLPILWKEGNPVRAMGRTGLAALVSLAALLILCQASGVHLRDVLSAYAGRTDDFGYRMTLIKFYEISSLGLLLLAAVGLAGSVMQRYYYPLWLLIAVLLPTLFLYSHSAGSPKYLYYTLPFVALLAAHGVRYILVSRRVGLGACIMALILAELFTGLRTTRVEFRRFTPRPTLISLSTFGVGGKRLQWVVGPGETIGNADGFSMWTGLAYAGIAWHREKETALTQIRSMREAIDSNARLALLTSTYASYQCAVGYLRQRGYRRASVSVDRLDPASHMDTWERAARVCWLAWINEGDSAPVVFAEYLRQFRGNPRYLFNDLGIPQARELLKSCPEAKLVGIRGDGFFALYELGQGDDRAR